MSPLLIEVAANALIRQCIPGHELAAATVALVEDQIDDRQHGNRRLSDTG
jgi:hypothetical protein